MHDPGDHDTPDADHRMPAWVKAFAVAGVVLALLLAVVLVLGGPGEHGPSRHASPGAAPPDDLAPPGDGHLPRAAAAPPPAAGAGGPAWR